MPTVASERGAATRERLIHAAAELIPELGWSAVTTRKVAARAGVRPGVVHYHFASVSELLGETAVRSTHEALTASFRALEAAPDVASALDGALKMLDGYAEDRSTALLLTESFLAATRDESLRARLRDELSEYRRRLAAWLRHRAGTADADASATVLAAALDGVFLHLALDPSLATPALRAPLGRLVAARGQEEEENR